MPKDRILEELQRNVGTQFDPTLVTLFLERVLPAIP
jgi:response regulator RpfG family c-di-GMP phosphodiesterase